MMEIWIDAGARLVSHGTMPITGVMADPDAGEPAFLHTPCKGRTESCKGRRVDFH
jgi:hypothetical protein